MKLKFFFSIFLIFVFSQMGAPYFKDYSKKGGEYEILKNIRLKANKVNFIEKRQIEVLGGIYNVSVFQIKAFVTIQTVESPIGNYSVFEELEAEYELIVGNDERNEIHNNLIEKIHKILIDNPKENFVFSKIGLTYKNNSYLIFTGEVYLPDLVWSEGKFVQLKFKKFTDQKKGGLGAEQSFWGDKIRFYPNGKKLLLEFMMNGFQEEFLRLYKEKQFNRS